MESTSKLNELSKQEREDLVKRLAGAQNGLCYVCSKIINPQVHEVDIDHIIAVTHFGDDNESNWGLTHRPCNRSSHDLSLPLRLNESDVSAGRAR